MVKISVGGGGDAYGKAGRKREDKKRLKFYDNREHFKTSKIL